ncbi:MAG: sugar-binding transcriptional regulator [Rhodospirillales bacterium]|nr:sugar-binding transcriptional regulator [Rhodospirillales bacterium]
MDDTSERVVENPIDDDELLAQIAWYYYVDGLTQEEIGGHLGLSRIKVSRCLDKGRRTGLIQVQINSPYEGSLRLGRALVERFGLADARVIPSLAGAPRGARIGQAAAHFLGRRLVVRDLLAVGWGEAVMATLDRLAPTLAAREISLVSLTGGVAAYLDGIGGRTQKGDIHLIPTPLRVSSPEFAGALRLEPYVRDVMTLALTAKIALVGIGAVSPQATLVNNGYCSASEIELFHRQGAVGDILGYFYDREGRILALDLHTHMVAVDPEHLRRIPTIIGAAAGPAKVEPILGALRGGLINNLITDEATAQELLNRRD